LPGITAEVGVSTRSPTCSSIHDVRRIERIRFATSHPDTHRTADRRCASLSKVCEHFSHPLVRAGDDACSRQWRAATASAATSGSSSAPPADADAAISADAIAWAFRAKSEAQFRATMDLVEEILASTAQTAAYSPVRPTPLPPPGQDR